MGRRQVIIVALLIAFNLAADSMLYINLPIYWREIGLSSIWEVGILLSINRFIRLPLNPLVGWIYSKIKVRDGLLLATIFAIISNLGYSQGQGLWAWILLRSIWGFSWALFSLGGLLTVINSAQDNNRGHLMGTYNGLYRLGSLTGMLLGGILTGFIGFQKTALVFGILSLISLFLLKLLKVDDTANIEQRKLNFNKLLVKPVLIVLFSGLIINMMYRGFLNSTLSVIIKDNFGLDINILGFIMTSTAFSGLIQAIRWSWEPFLAHRVGKWSDGPQGRIPLFIISLLVAVISFLLVPLQLSIYLWLIVVGFVMLTGTSLTTIMDALASDVAKKYEPLTIMTFYNISNDLGAALGPFIIYLSFSFSDGLILTFWLGALSLVMITVLWYRLNKI